MISHLWDDANEIFLAANWKGTHVVAEAGFLSSNSRGRLPYARRNITVNKMCIVRR